MIGTRSNMMRGYPPGRVVEVKFWGRSAIAFRDTDSRLRAFENGCAHRHVKLSIGQVAGCNADLRLSRLELRLGTDVSSTYRTRLFGWQFGIEFNPAVTMFQKLIARRWEEFLASQSAPPVRTDEAHGVA
jgi:hypothetical protein